MMFSIVKDWHKTLREEKAAETRKKMAAVSGRYWNSGQSHVTAAWGCQIFYTENCYGPPLHILRLKPLRILLLPTLVTLR
jgi:hypothetical protein